MEIDTLLIYTVILYLPGIIWGFADLYFGADRNMKMLVLLFKVHVFGIITYTLMVAVVNSFTMLFNIDFSVQNPILKFGNEFKPENYEIEIRLAFVTSLIFSLMWIFAIRFNLIRNFLNKIGAIENVPKSGVFNIAMASGQLNQRLVRIFDFENNRKFIGKILAYSELNGIIEVFLEKVTIYNDNEENIGSAEQYFISCKAGKFHIEVLNQKENT